MRVEIWRCQESWQVCSHSFDEVLYVLERLTLYIFSIPLHVDNKKLREIAGIADFKLRGHEDDERLTSILAICCVQAVIYIRDKDWKFLTIHSSVDKFLPNVSKYFSSSRRCSSSIDRVDKATTAKLSRCSQSQVWHVVYPERRQPFHPQWQWNHSTQESLKENKISENIAT
jgi:hypothetical protein